jgi:hypothetical protein
MSSDGIGVICAILVFIAPLTAVILSAFVRNRIVALLASLVVSGTLIAVVAHYTLAGSSDEDMQMVVTCFIAFSAVLSGGISLFAFVARMLSARSARLNAAWRPAT